MSRLVIIAGPQSSGKTTVFNLLKNYLGKKIVFLPEINPFTIKGKNHLGAAFTSRLLEIKIIEKDFEQLNQLRALYDRETDVIIETGIFHLVYAEMFGGQKLADIFYYKRTTLRNKKPWAKFVVFYKKYLSLYQNFHPVILFLDTKPAVSFRRRKPYYLKRIKKAGIKDPKEKQRMLKKYKKTIFQLYPLWLKWYKKFPFEKYMIKNSYKSEKKFLEEVMAFCKKYIAVKA